MPSTVESLFAAAGLRRDGIVGWGQALRAQRNGPGTGVYVVALTDESDATAAATAVCPNSASVVQELLDARPELTLDGARPSVAQLAARLAGFWCPDEVVVYMGRAGRRQRIIVSELADRVAEYYTTPLGARSPHAGGWPLKTLSNLNDLYVHYAYCADDHAAEVQMLDQFAAQLSEPTRGALHDTTVLLPFANLEDARKRRKLHGIKGARAPRAATRARLVPRRVRASVIQTTPTGGDAAMSAGLGAPELARRLGDNPKTLRAWLRSQAAAGNPLVAGHEHYGRWWFSKTEAERLADQYRPRR